jgi:hypothetical protein
MRKLYVVVIAVTAALAVTAVAYAVNEYTTSGLNSFSPNKRGSASKPVPVGARLGFNVQDTEGKRPKSMSALRIKLTGIVTNGRRFKACTATRIERDQSDRNCPRGSLIGAGFARNLAGNSNDFNDRSINCYLSLRLHNAGANKMALFVSGNPNETDPAKHCPLNPATAVPVNISRASGTSTMRLTIPDNLKRPAPNVTNSIIEMRLNVPRKTTRHRGKRVGLMEARGKCTRNRRNVTFTWINEDGSAPVQTARAVCRR